MSESLLRQPAVKDPDPAGGKCRAERGKFRPEVDHGRCEAKTDCVQACPYDVFEVRRIRDQDYAALGVRHKLKARVHGMQMAYVPGAADCRACGLCVTACPENAIALVEVAP